MNALPFQDLVWSDDFKGLPGLPDQSKWEYDLGPWPYNGEQEVYTNSEKNSYVDGNSHLVIDAWKDDTVPSHPYTSARLKTKDFFTHGRFEARVKIPRGVGLWPSVWLLGPQPPNGTWPASGELDIFENLGKDTTTVYGTIHGTGPDGNWQEQNVWRGPDLSKDFHIFGAIWEPEQITMLLDQKPYGPPLTPAGMLPGGVWPYADTSMQLLINLAVGGTWGGNPDESTVFPAKYIIDYIHIFQ